MNGAITTTTEGNLAGLLNLVKQLRFAVAAAATATVKEAQLDVIEAIQDAFITRSAWFAPSNRYGIHYKPATVEDPSAEIRTSAYWLVPHELGALKEAKEGQFLAIPTAEIQPNITRPVPPNMRPRSLPGAFILNTDRGPKLFQRINGQLRMVYNLVEQVQVRQQSTVIEPTIRTVQSRFIHHLSNTLQKALRTAK